MPSVPTHCVPFTWHVASRQLRSWISNMSASAKTGTKRRRKSYRLVPGWSSRFQQETAALLLSRCWVMGSTASVTPTHTRRNITAKKGGCQMTSHRNNLGLRRQSQDDHVCRRPKPCQYPVWVGKEPKPTHGRTGGGIASTAYRGTPSTAEQAFTRVNTRVAASRCPRRASGRGTATVNAQRWTPMQWQELRHHPRHTAAPTKALRQRSTEGPLGDSGFNDYAITSGSRSQDAQAVGLSSDKSYVPTKT